MMNSSPPKRAAVSLGTHGLEEALGDRSQYPVSGVMPEAVVYELEVVQVHEQDGHM